jgi:hypothetical protein
VRSPVAVAAPPAAAAAAPAAVPVGAFMQVGCLCWACGRVSQLVGARSYVRGLLLCQMIALKPVPRLLRTRLLLSPRWRPAHNHTPSP